MKAISSLSKHRRAVALILTIILITTASGIYAVLRMQQPDLTSVSDVMTLISRHMVLPSDETPALVTVTDPSKLSTEFLKNASAGDKVLIYQTNRMAIIYRPSVDKIIKVGPVTIDPVSGQSNQE